MLSIKNIPIVALLIGSASMLAGCDSNNGKGQKYTDTQTEGTIHISVDESFKPIIDSQIQVFESQHPKAHILAEYKSEADCFKDLYYDSTRMIIVTRGLTKTEDEYFRNKLLLTPKYGKLAYDAVAIVLNKAAKDSLFSETDIKEILAGTSKYKYKMVLDGLNATSTVRFAIDSLLKGTPMSKNVQAATSSMGVIDYVEKDPNAIGLVGISWLGKKEDSNQLSFSNKVKIGSLLCNVCKDGAYVLPYQANIATARYSMVRALYYVLKENGTALGSSFMSFLTNAQRGQLIFKRAYLLPAKMRYDVRDMSVLEEK